MMYLVTDWYGARRLINSQRLNCSIADGNFEVLCCESQYVTVTVEEFNRLLEAMRVNEGVVDLGSTAVDWTPAMKQYVALENELRHFVSGHDAREKLLEQLDVLWQGFSPEQRALIERKDKP